MSNQQPAPVVACISFEPWDAVWRRKKSYEYLAAARPVAATRTSGFQSLSASGLCLVDRSRFVAVALELAGITVMKRDVVGWDERAAQFADALLAA